MWILEQSHNNNEKVLVPSRYYFQKLAEMGVEPEKMEVFRRGVNQEKFNPSFRDKNFWKNTTLSTILNKLYYMLEELQKRRI
jgi:hypothetical protein